MLANHLNIISRSSVTNWETVGSDRLGGFDSTVLLPPAEEAATQCNCNFYVHVNVKPGGGAEGVVLKLLSFNKHVLLHWQLEK